MRSHCPKCEQPFDDAQGEHSGERCDQCGWKILDELYSEWEESATTGVAKSVEEICADQPHLTLRLEERIARASETSVGTGDTEERVQWFSADSLSFEPSGRLSPGAVIGDFEICNEIAAGGMGVVYRARQLSLNRDVALKMISSGEFASAEAVTRFLSEARSAARLNHPGIVQVYEVGNLSGRRYLAMELVEGESLAQRMSKGNPPSGREAAGILQQVAEAIVYAHQNGVVHRDLKPSNILIDANGVPKVTDFGLAKELDSNAELTQTNQILGTPQFMPPEQARGDARNIGPAADIYSLGATLYALLTSRPPFRADDPFATVRAVIEQEPVAPRRLNPSVDRDLETICLKCLEKEPASRYASATEFANDLKRYLAGEPIAARPIGRLARGWRWCCRNRLATALAVTIGTIAVVSPIFAIYESGLRKRAETGERDLVQTNQELTDANSRLTASNAAVLKQRKRAEQNLADLDAVVDEFLVIVAKPDGILSLHPGTQVVRKELLEIAHRHFQESIRKNQSRDRDPKQTTTLLHLATIDRTLGDSKASLQRTTEAAQQWEEILKTSTDVRHQRGFARTLELLGLLKSEAGQPKEGLKHLTQAAAVQTGILKQYPENQEYQRGLAAIQFQIGSCYEDMDQLKQALEHYRSAAKTLETVKAARPDQIRINSQLVVVNNGLALALEDLGRYDEALKQYEQSMTLLRELLAATPNAPDARRQLAVIESNRGELFREKRNFTAARKAFSAAIAHGEQLVRENPSVPRYRSDLASYQNNLGIVCQDLNDDAAARDAYLQALANCRQLLKSDPDNAAYLQLVAGVQNGLAIIYQTAGDDPKAVSAFEEAAKTYNRLAAKFPAVADYAQEHLSLLNNLGLLVGRKIDATRGLKILETSRKLGDELLRRFPDIPQPRDIAGQNRLNAGIVYLHSAQADEALTALSASLAIRRKLVRDFPQTVSFQSDMFHSLNYIAQLHAATSNHKSAIAHYAEAIAIRKRLDAGTPASVEKSTRLANLLSNLARQHALNKQFLEAATHFAESREIWSKLLKSPGENVARLKSFATASSNLGRARFSLKQYKQAVDGYSAAIAAWNKVPQSDPEITQVTARLAQAYANLADLHLNLRQPRETYAACEGARRCYEKLIGDRMGASPYTFDLATTFNMMAHPLISPSTDISVKWTSRTIALYASPGDRRRQSEPRIQKLLREAYALRAYCAIRKQQYESAARDWLQAYFRETPEKRLAYVPHIFEALRKAGKSAAPAIWLKTNSGPTPAAAFAVDLAGRYALAAGQAAKNPDAKPQEQQRQADALRSAAVRLLEYSAVNGLFTDRAASVRLKQRPDLKSLQSHPAFQSFLHRLEHRRPVRARRPKRAMGD